ncbi:hypothetical protein [Albimonas pacifica]|uniref:Phosphatidate cytidylyltransferase n=1 Tax=Albimonas pacifica TaxID=1114924 RepID=A0A1I3BPU0_9RHOB|nr:hypothetical protein [Albimonas pacifica]SFH64292.1 hypothetical protein SAMN05216258_101251 [Albimonas pacifica]
MSALPDPLRSLIAAEADAPAPPAARAFAERFAARPGVVAVLFYGAMMRDDAGSGLMDLYVLTDRARDWSGPGLAAAGCRMLPPNVHHERQGEAAAKVAVLTLAAFRRRMRVRSRDTTLWARFAQPVRLLHARDAAARAAVLEALEEAAATASWWAARLSEARDAETVWRDLFAATYGAELRVEPAGRSRDLVAAAPERWRLLHETLIAPARPDAQARRRAARAWGRRRRIGKALNLARLVKAAFTFRGGLPYIVSKIERHGGRPLELRPWERRLPWLAAPVVMLRLLREKRLR